MATELHDPYTVEDARRLVGALRLDVDRRATVGAGRVGAPVVPRARYCCASAGLEDVLARAAAGDPRCPCARAFGWHEELVR